MPLLATHVQQGLREEEKKASSFNTTNLISHSYNATYIHISVNSAVELLSRDTALIRNHKSTSFACVSKPCRLSFSFARWSDVGFF